MFPWTWRMCHLCHANKDLGSLENDILWWSSCTSFLIYFTFSILMLSKAPNHSLCFRFNFIIYVPLPLKHLCHLKLSIILRWFMIINLMKHLLVVYLLSLTQNFTLNRCSRFFVHGIIGDYNKHVLTKYLQNSSWC